MAGGGGGMFVLKNRRYYMPSKSAVSQGLVNPSKGTLRRKRKSTVMSGLRFVVKSKKKAESLGQQTQCRLS